MRIFRNLIVLIFMVFPFVANAQQDLSKVLKGTSRYLKQGSGGIAASIGEDKFVFDAKKGDFVESTFTVYNANSFSVIIDITPTAMVAGPGGSTNVVPLSSVGPTNLARHLKFRPKRFAMPPRSQKNVQFSINVPKGVSDGTHYTAFGVSSSATTKKAARLKEKELINISEMGFSPALRVNVSINVGGAGAGGGGATGAAMVVKTALPHSLWLVALIALTLQ